MTSTGRLVKRTYDKHFDSLQDMVDEIECLEKIAIERGDDDLKKIVESLRRDFLRHAAGLKEGAKQMFKQAA